MRVLALTAAAVAVANAADPQLMLRATWLAETMVQCDYDENGGVFPSDALWQSGNTVETLANYMAVSNTSSASSLVQTLLANTYLRTPIVVDNCFDDHQWWLHAWVRGYEVTGEVDYINRAAQVFDYVIANGWTEDLCGGGVLWCPISASGLQGAYKNAITNELFFTAAMRLHPYTAIVGRPAGFYLQWAQKTYTWLITPGGMINEQYLLNDGLNDTCQNNGQTTWTYNQGVLLDGLTAYATATGDSTALALAENVATAAMTLLSTPSGANGIFTEPCSNCDNDQRIFKGIFVRHLMYMLAGGTTSGGFQAAAAQFLQRNLAVALVNATCPYNIGGLAPYGADWQGPCNLQGTPSTSAMLDLILATASLPAAADASAAAAGWTILGLGDCQDAANASMPNCYSSNVSEAQCAAAAAGDAGAVAYDYETNCDGSTFCRVRTTSLPTACLPGWKYGSGSATTVTSTNGSPLTLCVLKTQ